MKLLLNSNTSFYLVNFRMGLIKACAEVGYDVYVLAPTDEFTKKFPSVVSFLPVHNLRRSSVNPLHDLRLYNEYLHLFRKVSPDIVMNFTIKPNVYGTIAASRLRIPSISVISGLGYAFMHNVLLKSVASSLYKFSLPRNEVVFENNDDLNYFVSSGIVPPAKATLVNGAGVDTEFFRPPPTSMQFQSMKKNIFLFVGRLLWDKGLKELVEATKILKGQGLSFEVWLLGAIDPDNKSAVPEKTIRSWEESGLVKYLGWKDDVREVISMSSCVVLPSYREGIPRALLEAMAIGKPIIASNVPGCSNIIDDGVNGFLVPPRSVEGLACAMKRFLEISLDEKVRMGIKSRVMAEQKFAEKDIAEQYIKLLENVVIRSSRPVLEMNRVYNEQLIQEGETSDGTFKCI